MAPSAESPGVGGSGEKEKKKRADAGNGSHSRRLKGSQKESPGESNVANSYLSSAVQGVLLLQWCVGFLFF